MIVIITTLHDKVDAARIGKGLLEKHLIACYNLWPIESAYWWKGKLLEDVDEDSRQHFEAVRKFIKDKSGYEVPEVIVLNPKEVDESYANWVKAETGS